MQITHEEAHKLIQFSIEQVLIPQEKNALRAHLESCVECRAYAEEIKEVESILVPLMKRQWSLQAAPLSIPALVQRKSLNWQTNMMLATRTVMISIVFAAFVF